MGYTHIRFDSKLVRLKVDISSCQLAQRAVPTRFRFQTGSIKENKAQGK